jgi:hypothetical protein
MSVKKWIRDWLNSGPKLIMSEGTVEQAQEHGVQISINSAINGRVLTLRTYQPSKHHVRSDWLTELYIVKDGESLTEALTMLLLMKGIDQ